MKRRSRRSSTEMSWRRPAKGLSEGYLAKINRDFAIIDALPKAMRELVHEHGAKTVVSLAMQGHSADQIEHHLSGGFDDLFD